MRRIFLRSLQAQGGAYVLEGQLLNCAAKSAHRRSIQEVVGELSARSDICADSAHVDWISRCRAVTCVAACREWFITHCLILVGLSSLQVSPYYFIV